MPRPLPLWLAWLQNLDRGLQRALNRQEFDVAQDIRTRREQVDKVLAAHLVRSQGGANAAITHWQPPAALIERCLLPACMGVQGGPLDLYQQPGMGPAGALA